MATDEFLSETAEAGSAGDTRFSVGEKKERAAETQQDEETIQRNREILKGVLDEAERAGTLGLAPNGKESNLLQHGGKALWGIVRTPKFKEWFGDWEKAARLNHINAIKPTVVQEHSLGREDLFNEYKNIGTIKNKADGKDVYFSRASFGKNYKKGGLFSRAVPGLADAFENSILAYSNEDTHGGSPSKDGKSIHKTHPNISMYHNYVGKMKIGGKDYYVRYTVTEETGGNPRFGVHSSFVSNVELYEEGYGDKKITTPERQIPFANLTTEEKSDRVVDTKLSVFFDAAKKSQENASKVVDENGEPLVVYHGSRTGGGFNVFGNNAFFTDNREVVESFKSDAEGFVTIDGKRVPLDAYNYDEVLWALSDLVDTEPTEAGNINLAEAARGRGRQRRKVFCGAEHGRRIGARQQRI